MAIVVVSLSLVVLILCCVGLTVLALRQRRTLADNHKILQRERREAVYFKLAAEDAKDGVVIHSLDLKIVWANPAYLRLMGRTAEEVIGHTPLDFAFPPDEKPDYRAMKAFVQRVGLAQKENFHLFRNMRGDGTLFWNQISMGVRRAPSGETHVVLVCRDVTETVRQEEDLRKVTEKLAHEASHDGLTGLANRAELLRFTRKALADANLSGGRIGMLHVDLDHFKGINDTHGHAAGDSALENAARQLRSLIRRSDMVARVGGDEFIVVCLGVSDLGALERIGRDLGAALARPFPWAHMMLSCRASIGCALSEPGEDDPQLLLLRSDFALYEAKRAGRARVAAYDEGLHQRHVRVQRRSADLREAVELGEMAHVFQPIVDLVSGRVSGFETLVRWEHPDEGTISPGDFLPLAEELGLLAQLDIASMEAALAMKRRLAGAGYGNIAMSFNASSDLLRHPSFVNRLVFGAEAAGMDRSQIAIEVLETTVFTDSGESGSPARIIRDLREAGFQVYLDDFGMGYAGLAHLAELAITGIKLDRMLVKKMLSNETSAKIVATITELCRDLGLRMVAEGVEDAATARRLAEMGCQRVQGYWLSHPLPERDAVNFVTSRGGLVIPSHMTARRRGRIKTRA